MVEVLAGVLVMTQAEMEILVDLEAVLTLVDLVELEMKGILHQLKDIVEEPALQPVIMVEEVVVAQEVQEPMVLAVKVALVV